MTIKICKCMLLGHYQGLIGLYICNEVNNSEDYKQTVLHSLRAIHHVLRYSHAPWDIQILCPVYPIFQGMGVALEESHQQGHGEGTGEAVKSYIICGL